MAHIHKVYDTDGHYIIDANTRLLTNASAARVALVQRDHNSERVTFELERYVDGHDMSLCNSVRISYTNKGASGSTEGCYLVSDLQVSPDDPDVVIFSWLISQNCTQYEGKLSFSVRFICSSDGSTVDYAWSTIEYAGLTVSKGLNHDGVDGIYVYDSLQAWIDAADDRVTAANQAADAAQLCADAAQAVKDSIPDDYATLDAGVKAIRSDLVNYNAANLATDWVKADRDYNGVRWTFDGDTVTASGTLGDVGSFAYLNGDPYALPSWFRHGETYRVKYASQGITLMIVDSTSGTGKIVLSTNQDAVFTVPEGMTRGSIRLYVTSGVTLPETVRLPLFMTAPSNNELDRMINDTARDVADLRATVDGRNLPKGTIPNGTDLNSVLEPGVYVLNSTYDYINSPRSKDWGGVLEVWEAHNKIILQRLTYVDSNLQDVRIAVSRSFNGHAWNEIGGALLASTNDTTDRTGDIQKLLNTTGACRLGSGVFYVTGITIPTGGLLTGSGKGTRLVLADSVADGYAVKIGTYGTVQDMSICGAASWVAKAADVTNDVGTRDGLIFEGLASTSGAVPYRSTVEAVMFYNLSGSAIRCENTGLSPASCLNVSDVYAFWCGCGVNIAYFSEYNRYTNVSVDGCGYGCINNGGNNAFVNCAFNSNNVGILMDNSTGQSRNNSHGTFAGCSINHSGGNTGTAIKMVGMENGQIFSACQIFYGKIVIDRCVGVRFVGANIGRQVPMEITNSKVVVFSDCNMYSADASPLTQSGNTTLKFSGCYCKDGSVFDPMAT